MKVIELFRHPYQLQSEARSFLLLQVGYVKSAVYGEYIMKYGIPNFIFVLFLWSSEQAL